MKTGEYFISWMPQSKQETIQEMMENTHLCPQGVRRQSVLRGPGGVDLAGPVYEGSAFGGVQAATQPAFRGLHSEVLRSDPRGTNWPL